VGERDNATPSELQSTAWLLQSGYTLRLLGDSPARETSWAMGVVELRLEVGGASTAWRSSKIKSRKV